MNDDGEQLAIMSEPSFGLRDTGIPVIWFSVRWGKDLTWSSLIVITQDHFQDFLKEKNVYDIKNLKDSPCQIDVSGDNVKFIKIL